MFASTKSTTLALGVAMFLSQSVAFADETSSTSIKTETLLGSASTAPVMLKLELAAQK